MEWGDFIDKLYIDNEEAKRILLVHSKAVADLSVAINSDRSLGLEENEVIAAAMLHDIGIINTNAPSLGCHGTHPYICHGILGASLLRQNGFPETFARISERHTGSGLTPQQIKTQKLPLPTDIVMVPETTLEKLICYADKFFSKRPGELNKKKTLEKVREEMSRHGEEALTRFEALHQLFVS